MRTFQEKIKLSTKEHVQRDSGHMKNPEEAGPGDQADQVSVVSVGEE